MTITPRSALVVEDNPEFTQLLREGVLSLGPEWRVQCVGTGAEGLAAVDGQGAAWNLILCDLGLPDMSGIAVIRAARRACAEAPVLVVSSMSNSESVLGAIRAGAQGYLHKGDSALSIAQAIRKVLDGEYPFSAALAQCVFAHLQGQAPAPAEGNPIRLSARELELLQLLSQGYQYDEAATQMGVSLGTIRTFVQRIYEKLQVNSKVKAIATARELGWL